MNNSLAIYTEFDNLQRAAMALQKSGFFPDVKSEAQAIVKVMAGAELGIPPFASMTGVHIIQGKPALGANVLATLVKNDPRYDYRIKVCNNDTCILTWYESGQLVGEAGFTMEEAKAAGLTGKDNWKKYPSDMLFARAISRGARRFAPGIFGGSPVYTPDELGADIDPDGFVETTITEVEHEPQNGKPAEESTEPLEYEYPEHLETILNSDGVRYIDLDTEKLGYMYTGITRAMQKSGLDEEKQAEYGVKHSAIREIMAIRNSG